MRDATRVPFFLGHVLEAIDHIQSYVEGMNESQFLTHRLVQDAVVRNLEIIGEACNNVRKHDPSFVVAHPEIPWANAIGNRNYLSHGYFAVSYISVWTRCSFTSRVCAPPSPRCSPDSMALKSTIFKANLAVADIDHNYYADHALTLARHPSENDERMMIRLIALALNAHKLQDVVQGDGVLAFGAGLSNPDDPDVSLRDFTGRTRVWIEVGQPEDKPLIKACGKADEVLLYCFSHAAGIWWKGIENKLTRPQNLQVWRVPSETSQSLATLAQRSMQLQATVQESTLTLGDGAQSIDIELVRLK